MVSSPFWVKLIILSIDVPTINGRLMLGRRFPVKRTDDPLVETVQIPFPKSMKSSNFDEFAQKRAK